MESRLNRPFCIWALQRTGSTTLFDILSHFSNRSSAEHEPFNIDREFWAIKREWLVNGDLHALTMNLRNALADGINLKHCYEIHEDVFNKCLLSVLSELNYQFVVLDRRNEINRILSLALAESTNAWSKQTATEIYSWYEANTDQLPMLEVSKLFKHMDICALQRQLLKSRMIRLGVAAETVFFEDLFSDWNEGRSKVESLLVSLDLRRPEDGEEEDFLSGLLRLGGQDSDRLLALIPNIAEVRSKLEAHLLNHRKRMRSEVDPSDLVRWSLSKLWITLRGRNRGSSSKDKPHSR